MKKTLFNLLFFAGFGLTIFLNNTAWADGDNSNCYPEQTKAWEQKLESIGAQKIAQVNYMVETHSYGANHYWKTMVASKYRSPDGTLSFATCRGIFTRNLKVGTQRIAGSWYDYSHDAPNPAIKPKMSFEENGEVEITVKDYTLTQMLEEVIVVDAHIVSKVWQNFPKSMLNDPSVTRCASIAGGSMVRCAQILDFKNQSLNVLGGVAKYGPLSFQVAADGSLAQLELRFAQAFNDAIFYSDDIPQVRTLTVFPFDHDLDSYEINQKTFYLSPGGKIDFILKNHSYLRLDVSGIVPAPFTLMPVTYVESATTKSFSVDKPGKIIITGTPAIWDYQRGGFKPAQPFAPLIVEIKSK